MGFSRDQKDEHRFVEIGKMNIALFLGEPML